MKRFVQIVLLSVAAASLAHGQATAKATDEQVLIQLENDWALALVTADLAVIARIKAPGYMFTTPDGTLAVPTDADIQVKSRVVKMKSFVMDDLKVVLFGDTAVVYGLDTEISSYQGKDTSGQYRFTDVFIKRNGKWLCITTHSSKVEKR